MIDRLHHARTGDMRIGEDLREVIDRARGHAESAKFLDPMVSWLQPQAIVEQALEFGPIVAPG